MTPVKPALQNGIPTRRVSLGRTAAIVALALLAVLLVLMIVFDWNWLKRPIERYVASSTGRTLVLGGDISGTWSLRPTLTFREVQFANPDWAEQPYLLAAEEMALTISLGTLFRRTRSIEALEIRGAAVGLELGSDDRRSWRLDRAQTDPQAFAIQRLIIERGRVRYLDRTGDTEMLAEIGARQADTMPISVTGAVRATPVRLAIITAGATETMQAAPDPPADSPRFSGSGNFGEARVEFTGHLGPGHALAGTRLDIRAGGPDLSAFRSLARAAIPATPRYQLDTALAIEENEATVQLRPSAIGGSRLRGELRVALGQPRITATGKFIADSFDLGDLGPLIGAGQVAAMPTDAEAKAKAAQVGERNRIFPDMSFETELWPNVDIDVSLEALRVIDSGRLAIDAFFFRARLQEGELEVAPLSISMANGKASGTLALKRRGEAVALTSRLRLSGLQLQRMAPATESRKASVGTMNGQFNIDGVGRSVRSILANSNGHIGLMIGRGEISNLLMDFAGPNAEKALRFLLVGDEETPLHCAVASLAIRNGKVGSEAVVIDTSKALIAFTGGADLAQERFDLTIHPQPKDWSLFIASTPIHIRGSFTDPQISVDAGPIGARAAAALLLGLVNPLAAILPLIDAGGAPDADCKALISNVKASTVKGKGQVPPGK